MTDSKSNCCVGATRLVLACSGASNVGQITNEAAKRLDVSGQCKFFCLAGIGAGLSGFVVSARDADRLLVLDGCRVGCARKGVEKAGIDRFDHITVTDLGVEKVHAYELSEADIERLMAKAGETLAAECSITQNGGAK
jgi:uncharacterized metal-binding protein